MVHHKETSISAASHKQCMNIKLCLRSDGMPRPSTLQQSVTSDYRIAGIYFEGINFRGWTSTKDFAEFIFVVLVSAFWRRRTSTCNCASTPLASNPGLASMNR